ncbi:MAG: leucyl aminopeptidase [Planctomycetota bacterium]
MNLRTVSLGKPLSSSELVVCFKLEKVKLAPHPDLARVLRSAEATGDVRDEFRKVGLFHTGDERWPRLIVVGLGKASDLDAERLRRGAAIAQAQAVGLDLAEFTLVLDGSLDRVPPELLGKAVAEGIVLGGYEYAAPRKKPHKPARLRTVRLAVGGNREAAFAAGVDLGHTAAAATAFARDLAHGSANIVTPARLAQEAKKLGGRGVRVRVLERADMQRLKMGAFLGVAQGSAMPPKLIVLDHAPAGAKKTLCVVGKGLTFDTGGISIKPSAKMDEMRYDMCGGAAVLGLFHAIRHGALAGSKQRVRVVGVVPATENMPGGKAQRPGDVVRACDGTTIEVLNTDAEGRLVLADAIAWAKKTYAPAAIVDVATLTGAVVVALGHEVTAVMGSDDDLVRALIAAGAAADETLWQLPLLEVHKKMNRSKFADLTNIPNPASGAGSIGAAAFLGHFADGTPWAHLDIAGTAWGAEAKDYYKSGATGVAVRTLLQWVRGG